MFPDDRNRTAEYNKLQQIADELHAIHKTDMSHAERAIADILINVGIGKWDAFNEYQSR